MAKSSVNIDAQCAKILSDVQAGHFSPVYLLMGDEPYYPELVCDEIIKHCIPEEEKDFNETICYGGEVTAAQIVTAARRFPMMAERQLVVVKEAQQLKDLEDLAFYCAEPLDSTVLVILLHGASADKRKSFYKAALKVGTVVDSPALRDYMIPDWIVTHFASRGLQIDPQAARLLAESAGTSLSTIVIETDKLTKALPEGTRKVSVEDIERNVGISRQFSIFELTKELSFKHGEKALKIATHLGNSAKFAMPMAVSALYTHFNRILRYGALLSRGGRPSPEDKARALAGLNPYFYAEYDTAVRNYPVPKAMAAISLLCEYDYLGKGGDGTTLVTDGELLVELTAKLLNL
ncbi:MAG: DNA polymerase III subunit delta [Bacteroidales bacterium]|nr:DNA polymerase III subunit delta [Bacteroidales bacterium]